MPPAYQVKDIALAKAGLSQINWAERHMPVMMTLRQQLAAERPLANQRIAGCLHVTKETAVLIRSLIAAGAQVAWSGCNPLSTQDHVAAALASEGVAMYAWHGMNVTDFYTCIDQTLTIQPTLLLDDGADLIMRAHKVYPRHVQDGILGAAEETTTGVQRLRSMAAANQLAYPVLAVNDAITKWDFDNVYGTGQSTMDGIVRATNLLIAGKVVVIAGYGHCGRGCAMRAAGMGARVVVTETDPLAALKAVLDGHQVMQMADAAAIGDVFVTTTGMRDVLVKSHFACMKDGAVLANAGHYDCEIHLQDLQELSEGQSIVRPNCEAYHLRQGKTIYLLAQGRLVNLVAAEGHPSEVMDMSFANQLLGMVRLAKEGAKMATGVYPISLEQDRYIAKIKLESLGGKIDTWTPMQQRYATDYAAGT